MSCRLAGVHVLPQMSARVCVSQALTASCRMGNPGPLGTCLSWTLAQNLYFSIRQTSVEILALLPSCLMTSEKLRLSFLPWKMGMTNLTGLY